MHFNTIKISNIIIYFPYFSLTAKVSPKYFVVISGLKSFDNTTYSSIGSSIANNSAIFFLSSSSFTFKASFSFYNLSLAYLSSNSINY